MASASKLFSVSARVRVPGTGVASDDGAGLLLWEELQDPLAFTFLSLFLLVDTSSFRPFLSFQVSFILFQLGGVLRGCLSGIAIQGTSTRPTLVYRKGDSNLLKCGSCGDVTLLTRASKYSIAYSRLTTSVIVQYRQGCATYDTGSTITRGHNSIVRQYTQVRGVACRFKEGLNVSGHAKQGGITRGDLLLGGRGHTCVLVTRVKTYTTCNVSRFLRLFASFFFDAQARSRGVRFQRQTSTSTLRHVAGFKDGSSGGRRRGVVRGGQRGVIAHLRARRVSGDVCC